jgi:hypothetical protein
LIPVLCKGYQDIEELPDNRRLLAADDKVHLYGPSFNDFSGSKKDISITKKRTKGDSGDVETVTIDFTMTDALKYLISKVSNIQQSFGDNVPQTEDVGAASPSIAPNGNGSSSVAPNGNGMGIENGEYTSTISKESDRRFNLECSQSDSLDEVRILINQSDEGLHDNNLAIQQPVPSDSQPQRLRPLNQPQSMLSHQNQYSSSLLSGQLPPGSSTSHATVAPQQFYMQPQANYGVNAGMMTNGFYQTPTGYLDIAYPQKSHCTHFVHPATYTAQFPTSLPYQSGVFSTQSNSKGKERATPAAIQKDWVKRNFKKTLHASVDRFITTLLQHDVDYLPCLPLDLTPEDGTLVLEDVDIVLEDGHITIDVEKEKMNFANIKAKVYAQINDEVTRSKVFEDIDYIKACTTDQEFVVLAKYLIVRFNEMSRSR